MPQAYPPQRGIGKRATKEKARTASLAGEMTGALPPYPRDLTHWGRQHGGGEIAFVSVLRGQCQRKQAASEDAARAVWPRRWRSGCVSAEPYPPRRREDFTDASSFCLHSTPTPCWRPQSDKSRGCGGRAPAITPAGAAVHVCWLTQNVEQSGPQPFQGEPRGESPTASCPKPTRRNAGAATAAGPPVILLYRTPLHRRGDL